MPTPRMESGTAKERRESGEGHQVKQKFIEANWLSVKASCSVRCGNPPTSRRLAMRREASTMEDIQNPVGGGPYILRANNTRWAFNRRRGARRHTIKGFRIISYLVWMDILWTYLWHKALVIVSNGLYWAVKFGDIWVEECLWVIESASPTKERF